MITDSGFDPIPRSDSKSAPGLLIPAPSLLLVNPPLVDSSSMLISAEEMFLVFSDMSFFISARLLLLSFSQSSLRLMVTVAWSSSILLTIFSFSARDSRRVSISATTASVFESVAPAGMVTLSLNSGVSTLFPELRLKPRLTRRAAKKRTSVPIIVAAGFRMHDLRTRW